MKQARQGPVNGVSSSGFDPLFQRFESKSGAELVTSISLYGRTGPMTAGGIGVGEAALHRIGNRLRSLGCSEKCQCFFACERMGIATAQLGRGGNLRRQGGSSAIPGTQRRCSNKPAPKRFHGGPPFGSREGITIRLKRQ